MTNSKAQYCQKIIFDFGSKKDLEVLGIIEDVVVNGIPMKRIITASTYPGGYDVKPEKINGMVPTNQVFDPNYGKAK